ncbi:hypothetical protein BO86DRAFT_399475 [Aspergillus japonicus CBS 114.51]|uniref:Uncharacterized protein n=1 Tax=Aspergillus japonicus CBS 114.51 TaxID=1448312 RepID=A0A8T8X1K7_ASPJA|nr:hypothetical protein BO86DRAFT_399475 [Aspergillus japonicus CBS 114.51]RAH81945.1 hypothetical protein BO86DRAFT_399475 [Aspergillus japonicus CBS 114.51]
MTATEKHQEISDLIGPAKQTIETIERGWDVMGTIIQYIYDQASRFEDEIPQVLLPGLQLDDIAKAWLKLNHYGPRKPGSRDHHT